MVINAIFFIIGFGLASVITSMMMSKLLHMQNYNTYLIDELPELVNQYSDMEVNKYKSSHCSNCKCYNSETNECHNALHYGGYDSKTLSYCIENNSYSRNKRK